MYQHYVIDKLLVHYKMNLVSLMYVLVAINFLSFHFSKDNLAVFLIAKSTSLCIFQPTSDLRLK